MNRSPKISSSTGNVTPLQRPYSRSKAPKAPEAIGRRVLKSLAAGRQQINAERKARGEFNRRMIAEYVLLELEAGRTSWGRSGRIARKLKGAISERQVRKYLAQLSCGSDSIK